MSDTSLVSKDVGGVPVWIWGAGVGAAIILYTYIKRASSSASTVVSGVDATPLDSSLNDFTPSGSGSGAAASTPTLTTNTGWIAAAESALQQAGFDPLTITSDLEGFINGDNITPGSQQAQIVSAAIASQGLPPDLNSGVSVSTPSAPASGPNFSAPYVTGDINQDTDIAASPYVAGAYAALFKPGANQQTVADYWAAFNEYNASKTTPAPTGAAAS